MLAPSYPVQTLSACAVCELLLAMSDTKSPRSHQPGHRFQTNQNSKKGQEAVVKLTTADADNHVWSSLPPALCADPLLILFNTRKHQCHSNVWQEEK